MKWELGRIPGCRRPASAPGGRWVQRGQLQQQQTVLSSRMSPGSPLWQCERTYRTPPTKKWKKMRKCSSLQAWNFFGLFAIEYIFLQLSVFHASAVSLEYKWASVNCSPKCLSTISRLTDSLWQLYKTFWKICHSHWQSWVSQLTQKTILPSEGAADICNFSNILTTQQFFKV